MEINHRYPDSRGSRLNGGNHREHLGSAPRVGLLGGRKGGGVLMKGEETALGDMVTSASHQQDAPHKHPRAGSKCAVDE